MCLSYPLKAGMLSIEIDVCFVSLTDSGLALVLCANAPDGIITASPTSTGGQLNEGQKVMRTVRANSFIRERLT